MRQRLWLRMELFEHFAMQFQSRCVVNLAPQNIINGVAALRQLGNTHASVERRPEESTASSTPTQPISYAMWKNVAETTFQWKDNECRSFWLVVVCLHHQIPILPSDDAQNKRDPSFLADEDYFLLEHVPLYKLATFLFLHMDKKSSKHRSKPSFDAVWRREDQPMTSPGSSGASSPVHLAAPISPSSPYSIGLKDRLESETHALNFVKANLDLLVSLVLDTSLTADDAIITAPQFDLLGVLFCGGASHVQQYPRLSAAYPKWQQPHQLASKVLKWLRTRLALNDVLYPRVGTCTPNNSIITTLHLNMPVSQDLEVEQPPSDNGATRALIASLPRPVVISLVSKATVIKRADEFMRHCDVTIFGCHDAYIYVLGPLRHVSVVASCNCKVVLGPASGICTVDRCDNTTVSATCALLRVHNCLDSTFNVFTPRRSIFDGDNRGCYIGPFNAQYPHLRLHLVQSRLAYVPHSTGQWNKFVNLDTDEPSDASADAAVVLQTPLQFTEVCVPVKMDAVSPRGRLPVALPIEFEHAVRTAQDNVDGLRRLIDEFDTPVKKVLEQAIQAKFKEWLVVSGNMRQVLDLVQLEKARQHAV